MKKILHRLHYALIAVVVFISLTGCALNITKDVSAKLDPHELYKSYYVSPIDLSSQSKCQKSPTVKVVNVESRTTDHTVARTLIPAVINPKETMDAVVAYLEDGFQQSNIKIDRQSSKTIQLRMVELNWIAGFWSQGAHFKTELVIPETGFTKYYEASDNSFNVQGASSYAIHVVTRQIIDDPEIQDYILCKSEKPDSLKVQDEEKSLTQKLQELQTALDNGLISEEEYQLKRKDLLENFK